MFLPIHQKYFSLSRDDICKIKKILDFRGIHTVKNYVKHLSEAFLVSVADRFYFKPKEQLKSPKKSLLL